MSDLHTTDPSEAELAQLVRGTLAARAATVTTGPAWDGAPAEPGRRLGWRPVAAAAAAVLGVGVLGIAGASVGSGDDGGTGAAAGGDENITCRTALPATWDDAIAPALTTRGGPADVVDAAPDGTLLLAHTVTDAGSLEAVRTPDGTQTPVPSSARSTDGTSVLLVDSDAQDRVTGLSVLPIGGSTRTRLLEDAPAPADWTVGSEPVLRDGVVYWGMSGKEQDGTTGHRIIGYRVADGTYRVLARPATSAEVAADPAGVWWEGGGVRVAGASGSVPAYYDDHGTPVRRLEGDGTNFAWQLIDGDQSTFHWTSPSGSDRFRLAPGAGRDPAGAAAAAGPFVFLFFNQTGANRYVYDTRTGALAELPRNDLYVTKGSGTLVLTGDGTGDRVVDAAALPGLTC